MDDDWLMEWMDEHGIEIELEDEQQLETELTIQVDAPWWMQIL